MEKLILYSPFIIISLYLLGIVSMMLYSNGRNTFFEAHKETSNYSWTRVAGTFLISSAIVLAFAQVLGGKEPNLALITAMITVAVGGKVAQKRVENSDSLFKSNEILEEDISEDEILEEDISETKDTKYGKQEATEIGECGRGICNGCDRNER